MTKQHSNSKRERRWVIPLVVGFVLFATVMFVTSAAFLTSWTDVRDATAGEAEQAFAEVRERFGAAPAFLEIDPNGNLTATHVPDASRTSSLQALHLLSFDPAHPKLIDVAFPYWFVRLKLSDRMNLGTMVSLMARDWESLDLRVTEQDLEALGPALLLDHHNLLASSHRFLL